MKNNIFTSNRTLLDYFLLPLPVKYRCYGGGTTKNDTAMTDKKIRLFTIPNFFTMGNLACGSVATVMALRHNDLRTAFWFIAAAAVLDFLDGFVARATKQYSEIGKQLDSLCDMVSFGLAPSAVLLSMYYMMGGSSAWGYLVFMVAIFSGLRLAKFNIDETQSDSFVGLPTPACALFFASSGWLMASGVFMATPTIIIATALCFSYFLISPLRMFAFKFHDFTFRNNALRFCFLGAAAIAVAVFRITAIPFIILAYLLISVICACECTKS